MNATTLPQLLDRFFEYLELERNVSALTIRNYRHYLQRFTDWYRRLSPALSPRGIDRNTVRRYRLYLNRFSDEHGEPLKRVTQNYHLIALRSFLKFLAREDIETISAEQVELGKSDARDLEFLNRQHVERLLAQPSISEIAGLRDKAMLETLFSTGLRVSELVKLNREDVDTNSQEIGIIGKGRRHRVVFLSDRALLWITRYLRGRDDHFVPLFIRYGGKKPDPTTGDEQMRLSVRGVQRIVDKYARSAHLPLKITPHGVRHSFATDLLSSGADLRAIQEMLGHKNIATTQIYTHVTNPQLKKIHQRYHGK